jgi:FG-GAP-like repeat/Abnormal spindle-like microcephaly-assoc'd, ASPM-SPD-2-Hydin/FG-GAP repeat
MKSAAVFLLIACLSAIAFAQANPVPLVDLPLVPTSAAPGSPGFTLTVNGANFVSGAVVNWNGHPLATQFVSKNRLTASVPASEISVAETASVTVANSSATSSISNAAFFSVTMPTSSVAFSGQDFAVGGYGLQPVAADFNGDGKLDLAVTNELGVEVLLGKGNGTFAPAINYPAAFGTYGLATADVNGDGNLDLLVVSNDPDNLAVFLGNGDGTFQSALNLKIGYIPSHVVAADFNGDGKLDLAITLYEKTALFLGNGDGTFQSSTFLPGDGGDPICVGDFNGDGIPDIAIGNFGEDNNAEVFLGRGDGTFAKGMVYSAGQSEVLSISAADLNGDGVLDLVVGGNLGVSILLGNGNGTFGKPTTYLSVQTYGTATVADFNGDGKPDIAITDGNTISAMLGYGDGTFAPVTAFEGGPGNFNLTVGDFNGDGAMDIATAAQGYITQTAGAAFVGLQTNGPAVLFSVGELQYLTLQPEGVPSPAQPVTLTNTGKEVLDLTRITFTGSNAKDFSQTNDCGSSVAVGASCVIDVVFDPTGKGPRTATLDVVDNALGQSQPIALSGYATVITLSPSALNFGDQKVGTKSTPKTVTVTNVGRTTVTISNITFAGDATQFTLTSHCGPTLAAGASCTVDVVFAPAQKHLVKNMLAVIDNGGGTLQEIPISGTGT